MVVVGDGGYGCEGGGEGAAAAEADGDAIAKLGVGVGGVCDNSALLLFPDRFILRMQRECEVRHCV